MERSQRNGIYLVFQVFKQRQSAFDPTGNAFGKQPWQLDQSNPAGPLNKFQFPTAGNLPAHKLSESTAQLDHQVFASRPRTMRILWRKTLQQYSERSLDIKASVREVPRQNNREHFQHERPPCEAQHAGVNICLLNNGLSTEIGEAMTTKLALW